MKPSIMVGVTTFNRPSYLRKSLRAIAANVLPDVDAVIVHNDGSDNKYNAEYRRAYSRLDEVIIQESPVNEGVAKSKNAILRECLNMGADYVFLVEDDIIVQSPNAIHDYIHATEISGLSHLNYALHGPANRGFVPESDDVLSYYPHSVGAFSLFTASSLRDVGLFDENLHNAWEHVELALRLAQAGYTSGAYRFADVKDSDKLISEIPGSIDKSSIRPLPNWRKNIRDGMIYWRDNKPETWAELFGPDKPLALYAQSVIDGPY